LDITFYLIVVGLGCVWLGSQIIWVAGLPKQFQFHQEKKNYEIGSEQAFMAFWFNQYAWIGAALVIFGLISISFGIIK